MLGFSRSALLALVVLLQACGGSGGAKVSQPTSPDAPGSVGSSLPSSSIPSSSLAGSSVSSAPASEAASSAAVPDSIPSSAASSSLATSSQIVLPETSSSASSLILVEASSSSQAASELAASSLPTVSASSLADAVSSYASSSAIDSSSSEVSSDTSSFASVAASSLASSASAVEASSSIEAASSSLAATSDSSSAVVLSSSSEALSSSSLSSSVEFSSSSLELSSSSSSEAPASSSLSSSAEASSLSLDTVSSSSSEVFSSSSLASLSSLGAVSSSSLPADFPVGTVDALPVLSVNTEGGVGIVSKEVYVNGSYSLAVGGATTAGGTLEVRGRGNSTWLMPKKPYRLKLTTATSLMGMPSNRHWVLLANYSDKTLMRNDITFMFSRSLGMEYTPRSQYVDLMLNGVYQGVYQLVEHIRIDKNRVNIPELKVGDTAPEKISGGYLMEIDERRGENFCIDSQMPTAPMVFCLASPESLAEVEWLQQRQYIERYIHDTEAAIFASTFADPDLGYAAYIDVDSMINYYLINELFRNVDGNLRLSTYLYKKRDGKLFFGPLWDFDLAIGNVNYDDADKTTGWYIRTAPWFARLFQDPVFEAKVKARWQTLKAEGKLEQLFQYSQARALWLDKAQAKNFDLWRILDTHVWPNRVVTGSYAGEVDAMDSWLRERMAWMDAQLSQ